jgi:addiction module RelB/DinJ family antitoxin
MAVTDITLRLDDGLKAQCEGLFNDMGLNMTSGILIYLKEVARMGKIPFELESDRATSGGNYTYLKNAIAAANAGRYEIHELIEV